MSGFSKTVMTSPFPRAFQLEKKEKKEKKEC